MSERICTVCSTAIADVDRLRSALTASESRVKELEAEGPCEFCKGADGIVPVCAPCWNKAQARVKELEKVQADSKTKLDGMTADRDAWSKMQAPAVRRLESRLVQAESRVKSLEAQNEKIAEMRIDDCEHAARCFDLFQKANKVKRAAESRARVAEEELLVHKTDVELFGTPGTLVERAVKAEARIKALEQENARIKGHSITVREANEQLAAANRSLREALENGWSRSRGWKPASDFDDSSRGWTPQGNFGVGMLAVTVSPAAPVQGDRTKGEGN